MTQGIAKQLFIDKEGYSPWGQSKETSKLTLLLECGAITEYDYYFVERMLSWLNTNPIDDSDLAVALCFLTTVFRSGHLCVEIDQKGLLPDPISVWEETISGSQESTAETNGILVEMSKSVLKELHHLPDDLIHSSDRESTTKPFLRYEGRIYSQKTWTAECRLLDEYHRLNSALLSSPIDESSFETKLQKITGSQMLPEQLGAIVHSLRHPITFITGGPGTGKTYTASKLVEALQTFSSPKEIIVTAPTGKAASHLYQVLLKNSNLSMDSISFGTLHSVLGLSPHSKGDREIRHLKADVILVDECSMIDIHLLSTLFASVKEGARLILLGDPYQLPPVDSGTPFKDLIVMRQKHQQPVSTLIKCLRSDIHEIVDYASAVKNNDQARILHPEGKAIQRRSWVSPKQFYDYILPHFQYDLSHASSPQEIIDQCKRHCLLSPLRKGSYGIEMINKVLQQRIESQLKPEEIHCVPILITRNSSSQNLFNGDFGVLVNNKYGLFPSAEGIRTVPVSLLPPYQLGYCMTVHQSQGSEFEHITLLMPEGAEHFGREVLYTAITRAKKRVEIWGDDEVLVKTLKRSIYRNSGICARDIYRE